MEKDMDPPPNEFKDFVFYRKIRDTDPENYFEKNLDSFSQLQTQISDLIDNPLPKSFRIDDVPENSPLCKFLAMKFKKYSHKLELLSREYYKKKGQLTNELSVWLSLAYTNGYFVLVDSKQYKQKMEIELLTIPEITDLTLRCSAFLLKFRDSIPSTFTIEDCIKLMKTSAIVALPSLEYAPHMGFDDVLEDFLWQNGMIKRFDAFAESPEGDLKSIDIAEISQIYKSFLLLLQPATKEELYVARSALMRLCFDSIYVKNFAAYSVIDEKLLVKCQEIANKTPRDLEVNEAFIPKDYYDKPFSTLIKETKELMEVSEIVASTQFHICPIDIAALMYEALKKIEEYELSRNVKDMCFDDFFELFLPLFAFNPPVNFVSVAGLLRKTTYKLSSSIDFARLVFISSVDYVIDYK